MMRVIHFDSFVSIGATTASIVERLAKHEPQPGKYESKPRHENNANTENHREYVVRYMRDIAAFERRFRGQGIN
jgi:hypothetical protein